MTKNTIPVLSRLIVLAAIISTSATAFATQLISLAPTGGDIPIQSITDGPGQIVLVSTIEWANIGTDWATGSNWSGGTAPADSTTTDIASFGSMGVAPVNPTLAAARSVNGVSFLAGAYSYTVGGATLTIGGGGISDLATNGETFSNNLATSTSETWSAGSGATLTLNGTVNISSASSGTRTLTLGGGGNKIFNGAVTFTGSGTGVAALTLSDPGAGNLNTVTLAGNNTYNGNTTITTRTLLNINSSTALGTGALVLTGSATIDNTSGSAISMANVNNINLNTGSLTFTGTNNLSFGNNTVTMNNASRSITTNAGVLTIGAIAQDVAGRTFTKSGTGALVLIGASSYTGSTTISAGTLQLGNGGTTGTLSPSSTISIASGATLRFDHTSGADFVQGTDFSSSAITGAGQIIKEGTCSLTFNVANTFSGGLTINKGTVVSAVDGALGTGNVSLTAGNITLTLSGASNNIADSATLSYVNTDVINLNNTTTDTVAGLIVDGVAQAAGVYGASAINPDGAFFGVGTITVVPEPTTVGMVLLGASLLAGVQRFRRRQG